MSSSLTMTMLLTMVLNVHHNADGTERKRAVHIISPRPQVHEFMFFVCTESIESCRGQCLRTGSHSRPAQFSRTRGVSYACFQADVDVCRCSYRCRSTNQEG